MSRKQYPFWHAIEIIWQIGWADFFLKYRGSVLGYLWSFADPLLRFVVIYIVFQRFVPDTTAHYALFLFVGIITWDFFARTVSGCISMLQEKSMLIQKVPFPHVLLVFAVGWTNTIIFCTHLCIFALFALLQGVVPTMSVLLLPIGILVILGVALGLGMLLSAFSLKFRDIPHLWQAAQQILFWLTPVFYPVETVSSLVTSVHMQYFSLFIRAQPVTLCVQTIRRMVLPTMDAPGIPFVLSILSMGCICFTVGYIVFRKRSTYFIEEY